ncbi:AI-2E family transporter [Mycobacterium sp. KBS0706]|uniref:AI-2E family transporter n=1 Tax=Mycobacterium sp. KBS0706 TaxID=2578109 RepID=UPI00110FF68C|nr:AI-2E family transporter [Mycobacterium sp. KBS0706]TSD86637.1 AI-2E family transporter [Mycobacterium sp. KBS0706]
MLSEPGRSPRSLTPLTDKIGALSSTNGILLILAATAALYFGRDILIPFSLALLISFAMAPVVLQLRKLGLPRTPAVLVVIVALSIAAVVFIVLVASQAIDLAGNLPRYQSNLEAKIQSIKEVAPGGGLIDRLTAMVARLSEEATERAVAAAAPMGVEAAQGKPVPVQLVPPALTPLQLAWEVGAPLLEPFAIIGVVLVFSVFMLLEREDLRNRLIWLLGSKDLTRATAAMDDAAQRLSRFLLAQALLNFCYGAAFGAGLWVIGVPNPVLWGLLSAVLRFIPLVGTVSAALLPTILAFAVDPGWLMPLATIALFVVLDLITVNVGEPLLYGGSTGLSPFAVLFATIFWLTLWGIPGLLLAVPLTVCLAVLGRHVPQFGFLDVLLGSTPALTPEAHFYQRILAGDPLEASELAERGLQGQSRQALFESMILPAIHLAQADRQRGALDGPQRAAVWGGILTAVADLDEDGQDTPPAVLCLGARDELDQAAALMTGQILAEKGIACRYGDRGGAVPEAIDVPVVMAAHAGIVTEHQLGRLIRRLRRRIGPDAMLVVGLLGPRELSGEMPDGLEAHTVVVRGFSAIVAAVTQWTPKPAGNGGGETGREAMPEPSGIASA